MRKLLFASAVFTSILAAQTNVVYNFGIQASPSDDSAGIGCSLTLTNCIGVTQDQAVSMANKILSTLAPGAQQNIKLTAGVTAAATTIPLNSTTGLQIGNGLCFSPGPGCSITMATSLSLSTGEVALVTGIAGNNVTVERHSIGTAAAYTTAQNIAVIAEGSYSVHVANTIRADFAANVANPALGSASGTAYQAAIAAAQAALEAAQ